MIPNDVMNEQEIPNWCVDICSVCNEPAIGRDGVCKNCGHGS